MPTFETPYGTVDAPDLGAAQKWIARQKPAKPADGGGSTAGALWDGLMHGAGNVLHGAARIGVRAVTDPGAAPPGEDAVQAVDRAALKRQESFEQQPSVKAHPTATAIGEVGGEMAATAPLGVGRALAPVWERMLQGAAAGAATGAVGAASQAPSGQGFAPAVAKGAGLGAGAGAGASAAGSAARPSSLAAPRTAPAAMVSTPEAKTWREAARMLTSQNVRLSPGQARNAGYKERSLQEWPILRNLVRGAVGRSVDDFDRAVVGQALSPLGAIVPRKVAAGHDLMEFGTKQLDQAYSRVLPSLSLKQPGIAHWLGTDPELQKIISEMATDDARRLQSTIQNRLLDPLTKGGGVIDGATFKRIEGDLSKRAADFRGTNSNEIGRALDHVIGGLRDELANQNSRFAPELQKINQAFSMWARVRAASIRNADGKGHFSPDDLLQTLKNEDPSSGGNSFARGRQPMQSFAEAGSEIIDPSLTSRVPETTKSAARYMGDVIGGGIGTIPYAAAMSAQAVPGLGRGIGSLGPGMGFETGRYTGRHERGLRPSTGAE